LGTGGRAQRVVGTAEHRVHPVAPHLHDPAIAGQDRVTEERVVPREVVLHRVGEVFPETRRTLEIGEEEGHRARGASVHAGEGRPDVAGADPPIGRLALPSEHAQDRN
jgi:hypothetical protein